MTKVTAKPQLGFGEAVKLAMSRLTDIKGRSRRSEYWWALLAFLIFYWIVSVIATLVLPYNTAQIISSLLTILVLPLTIRRVQDTGHNMLWPILSFATGLILSLYMVSSGILEMSQSVNPDPDAILEKFTSPVVIVCSFVSFIAGIATFVFTLLDSQPETNKYGESPKYVAERDFSERNPERNDFQGRDFEEVKL
ncbi:MAG: DUF805 domain-containing protein [Prevotella sp.]|nr:DUF805 domain-containing protein [Prevotella sp.]